MVDRNNASGVAASSHLRRRIKRHNDGPEKDIEVAVGFFLAGADSRFCRTVMSGMGAVVPVRYRLWYRPTAGAIRPTWGYAPCVLPAMGVAHTFFVGFR